jgi:16S rRNA C1402 N4-methylase RsmH
MAIWKKNKLGELGAKVLQATDEELEENTRSKSAKLYSFLFF